MREKLIKYLDKAFISLMAINLVLVVLGSAFILSDKVFVKNAERTKGYISHIEKQDDGKEKAFSLGRSEAAQKRHDIGLKGAKYILTAVITSYFTMKLVQNPSWETVANIIKDLIPMTTSAVMATKSGIEAVDNNIVTRYQKRRRLLIQYCDKNAIPTDINSELGESQL